MRIQCKSIIRFGGVAIVAAAVTSQAQTLVADYQFNNNLNSSVAGAPALSPIDPLGGNNFGTATVFGNSHSVYNYVGNPFPTTDQGGLSLDTTGLIGANNYSVQLVLSVDNIDGNGSGWVRLIDVQNRTSDNGFYYDPSHQLDIYPVASDGATVSSGTFEDVVLTVAADHTVDAYLNNVLAFETTTDLMDINNPADLMLFFADNTEAGGQGEFSNGSVAEIKIYDGVLTADQVAGLDSNPLSPVPDSGNAVGLLSSVLIVMSAAARKFRG